MTSSPDTNASEDKHTIEEWLEITSALGYFLTQPRTVYEAKGWKAVTEFAACMIMIGLFIGLTAGGAAYAAKYYDHKLGCEAVHGN